MNTKDKILELLRQKTEVSVHEMTDDLTISRQMIHRALKQLIASNKVVKIGKPPKVFYRLNITQPNKNEPVSDAIDESIARINFIEEHFVQITETGNRLNGLEGFIHWCKKRNQPVAKTFKEYIKTRKKYLRYFNRNGLIDGTDRLKSTKGFEKVNLKKLYYADFYAIERFEKTKLGQYVLYAKQGQNREIITEIARVIEDKIQKIIKTHSIDAVGYIPHTVQREVQLMKQLEGILSINLPIILIEKVKTDVIVPQKTLSKLEDRIANARHNMVVPERRRFKNVLLIDDAVGSGATLNETAGKMLDREVAKATFGFAVTGSFKGFDVISEA